MDDFEAFRKKQKEKKAAEKEAADTRRPSTPPRSSSARSRASGPPAPRTRRSRGSRSAATRRDRRQRAREAQGLREAPGRQARGRRGQARRPGAEQQVQPGPAGERGRPAAGSRPGGGGRYQAAARALRERIRGGLLGRERVVPAALVGDEAARPAVAYVGPAPAPEVADRVEQALVQAPVGVVTGWGSTSRRARRRGWTPPPRPRSWRSCRRPEG